MSKSLYNVVNPDELIAEYGADTLRLYEMFLGPLEQSKPWDTKGMEGVFRFIRKFWRLFHDDQNNWNVSEEAPTCRRTAGPAQNHQKSTGRYRTVLFQYCGKQFMICTNELTELKCNKRAILEDLVILVSPYAPHLAEELWNKLGHNGSVSKAVFPVYNEEYTVENTFEYPVSFNGKMRFRISLPARYAGHGN